MRHQIPPRVIDPNWTPTAENINALPKPLRRYIHDLQSNIDPAGMMRENFRLRQEVASLRKQLRAKSKEQCPTLVPDAFHFDD